MLTLDPRHKRLHLSRVQMIDLHGDAMAPGVPHQLGGLFNDFGSVNLRSLRACASAGAVYGGSRCAQFDSDAAAGAARCPCYQGNFTLEYLTHHQLSLNRLHLKFVHNLHRRESHNSITFCFQLASRS